MTKKYISLSIILLLNLNLKGQNVTIKKIENKDWSKNKKGLSKQERYRNTLYRKLNRHIEKLVNKDSNFKDSKLYRRALAVYNKKEL